jgi:hypothetical protein
LETRRAEGGWDPRGGEGSSKDNRRGGEREGGEEREEVSTTRVCKSGWKEVEGVPGVGAEDRRGREEEEEEKFRGSQGRPGTWRREGEASLLPSSSSSLLVKSMTVLDLLRFSRWAKNRSGVV